MAGEASGDLHGANLADQLSKLSPDIRLFGMGGNLMKQAGVRLLFNPTTISTIGFLEALKSVHLLRRVLLRLGETMDRQRPDAVVLIDFPGFNMRFAEMAKRKGIPVIYYFSPSAWAWGRGRAEKVAEMATKVASVFPFEYEVYKAAGANVEFVGHPLLDIVRPTMSREAALQQFGLSDKHPIVGLLPGSREQEIRSLFPVMLKAAEILRKRASDAQYVVPVAHTVSERKIIRLSGEDNPHHLIFVRDKTYDVLNVCDLAVIACGTATLEAALLGTPLVAVYRVFSSTYYIAKMVLKIPYVALPNIVAGREIVPELIQNDATPDKIAKRLEELWFEPERREKMRRDFEEMKQKLGEPGAVARVARMVLEVAAGHHNA